MTIASCGSVIHRSCRCPAWTLEPGIGYAITDDGPLTQYETWPGRPSKIEEEVGDVVKQLASESTLRGGRLLAPYAIRYMVVPIADGAASTVDQPLPLPVGLTDALDDQLDFAAPLTRPLNFVVYENTAWIPTRAQFTGTDADATQQAGLDSLATLELRSAAVPVAVGAPDNGRRPVRRGARHGHHGDCGRLPLVDARG